MFGDQTLIPTTNLYPSLKFPCALNTPGVDSSDSWVADLPSIFEQTPHLTLVSAETAKVNHGLLRTLSELQLWGIEDACTTLLRNFPQLSQRVKTVRELAKRAEKKVVGEAGTWEGVWAPIVSVVGRKEST